MTMIAATVIAYQDNIPYFLVKKTSNSFDFLSVKEHLHDDQTSLGCILDAFKKAGVRDFSQWQIGELAAVKGDKGNLMPLYSFEISDWQKVQKDLKGDLMFESANKIQNLLTTLKPSAFTAFEDI
ncbi:hypothetical protein [Convivina intestini]|uniref:Uncharacterized protein n=1 Tax=Convivina intestini TaxID=1505726 RepID=A0A2U1DBT8_9LACO|nr:hypothetical protein [Convivina intestini]PVY85127.1 hypothetical protein C7384_103152 [Convivina intestini]CAH1853873.1 hypothetical protein R077811_00804 [Convivina intestini]SDB88260.1 hypothetical protein SAMN05216341_1032 [Leuconostocaceae bacterium R-53105]